jgi:hypothetical protein
MTTAADLARSRRETSVDMARLLTSYLEDASEALRLALARAGDSALEPGQRLPDTLVVQLVNTRLAIKDEILRRSR